MQLCWTAVLLASFLTGTQGLKLPDPAPANLVPGESIDDVSDSSSDIILSSPGQPHKEPEDKPYLAEVDNIGLQEDFNDPKIYGMNIGLHFILDNIGRKLAKGGRVHLESLIKVLVLTHNIEKVGGTVNESNRLALRRAAVLYPRVLREAMQD